jgi:hypothetical protein
LIELPSRGEVKLKGKAEPAPVFAVEGVRAMPEPLRGLRGMRSPLVGRQAELVYNPATGWAEGTGVPVNGPLEYLVQAVDGTGNVAL